jgi:hypothetical protein
MILVLILDHHFAMDHGDPLKYGFPKNASCLSRLVLWMAQFLTSGKPFGPDSDIQTLVSARSHNVQA